MNNSIKFLVDRSNNNKRIDIYLSEKIKDYTRSYIKKLIKKNQVKLNKATINSTSAKIKTKDEIVINVTKIENFEVIPKKIQLDIIYEDGNLLIINKPKGMVVHPGAGNSENTLVNALVYKFKNKLSDISGDLRPGIVHRIDKDTSGLLVVAKNNLTHAKLGKQFSDHSIKRSYRCLTWGVIRPLKGRIETLISRNKKNRKLMAVSDISGKKAITNYETLKVFNIKNIPKISLIECRLETGRTHQIRVHLKYKGTSIIGDNQYGRNKVSFKKTNKEFLENLSKIKGQILHAQSLEFSHPITKEWLIFKSELPTDFKKLLNLLNKLSS
tara:strand:- start:300 stop:1280 length:981 start_codon:yes stop_codon:yes gene_type:complete